MQKSMNQYLTACESQTNPNSISWVCTKAILFLFPILPQYIYIVPGLNLVNGAAILLSIIALMDMKSIKWRLTPYAVPFIIYELYYVFSLISEGGLTQSFAHAICYIFIPMFVAGTVCTRDRFIQAIDTLILAGAFLGILGIFEAFTGINIFQMASNAPDVYFSQDVRYGLLRVLTTFSQPISYGLFQVFICALCIYRLNISVNNRDNKFLHIAYLLSVINVVLSVSRIPIIACVIIHIILLYKKSNIGFINYLVYIEIIICILALFALLSNINVPFISDLVYAFGSITGEAAESSSAIGLGDRLDLWDWVFSSMGKSWVFGRGILTEFSYTVYEWQIKTSIENQYLSVLFHIGLVGLGILIISYCCILYSSARRSRLNGNIIGEKRFPFNYLVLIVLAVYYICQFGVQETDMARIYVLLIALSISYNRLFFNENQSLLEPGILHQRGVNNE